MIPYRANCAVGPIWEKLYTVAVTLGSLTLPLACASYPTCSPVCLPAYWTGGGTYSTAKVCEAEPQRRWGLPWERKKVGYLGTSSDYLGTGIDYLGTGIDSLGTGSEINSKIIGARRWGLFFTLSFSGRRCVAFDAIGEWGRKWCPTWKTQIK